MTNIVLVYTNDEWTHLRPGSRGVLLGRRTDPFGGELIDVKWEDGSSLSLIAGVDRWREETA